MCCACAVRSFRRVAVNLSRALNQQEREGARTRQVVRTRKEANTKTTRVAELQSASCQSSLLCEYLFVAVCISARPPGTHSLISD